MIGRGVLEMVGRHTHSRTVSRKAACGIIAVFDSVARKELANASAIVDKDALKSVALDYCLVENDAAVDDG